MDRVASSAIIEYFYSFYSYFESIFILIFPISILAKAIECF